MLWPIISENDPPFFFLLHGSLRPTNLEKHLKPCGILLAGVPLELKASSNDSVAQNICFGRRGRPSCLVAAYEVLVWYCVSPRRVFMLVLSCSRVTGALKKSSNSLSVNRGLSSGRITVSSVPSRTWGSSMSSNPVIKVTGLSIGASIRSSIAVSTLLIPS